MIRKITIALVCTFLPVVGYGADFDGSKRLLCAVVESVECERTGECIVGPPEKILVPDFFTLDLKKKRISAEIFGQEIENTAVDSIHKFDDRVVFQGMEDERGWSGVLDKRSGRLTMSSSDSGVAFILFGSCHTY